MWWMLRIVVTKCLRFSHQWRFILRNYVKEICNIISSACSYSSTNQYSVKPHASMKLSTAALNLRKSIGFNLSCPLQRLLLLWYYHYHVTTDIMFTERSYPIGIRLQSNCPCMVINSAVCVWKGLLASNTALATPWSGYIIMINHYQSSRCI